MTKNPEYNHSHTMFFMYFGLFLKQKYLAPPLGLKRNINLVLIFVFLLSLPESFNDGRHRFWALSLSELGVWVTTTHSCLEKKLIIWRRKNPWKCVCKFVALGVMTWSEGWLRESILRSVTTAGRLRAKETSKGKSEEREDEGSKHEAEESKDHRVLDRGGVEGQRCGTVTSNCVEPGHKNADRDPGKCLSHPSLPSPSSSVISSAFTELARQQPKTTRSVLLAAILPSPSYTGQVEQKGMVRAL